MKLTNKYDLPEALVRACGVSPHNNPGNVSATTLLKGVREILLVKRHWSEMTADVSTFIWAIFGTAVHKLLEIETPDTFTEESFSIPVDSMNVTGRIDCYDMKHGIVIDYKTASVWKVLFNDYTDWRKQGLIYAWLLHKSGFPVSECRFIAMLKDHSARKAKFDSDYPDLPVHVYSFPVRQSDIEETEKMVFDKVKNLIAYADTADDDLPICTPEERWAKETKYAVHKKGVKKALRLFDTQESADLYSADKPGTFVEKRDGEDVKCLEYCSCSQFCNFYKQKYGDSGAKE